MTRNILLSTDSYKHSHYLQYPPGAENISSYIEAREGSSPQPWGRYTQFFGLQAFIADYLLRPFTQADIDEAAEVLDQHGLPFNRADWTMILNDYGGYLPLDVQALPEGTIVPRGTPMVQVSNTDAKFPWLTSFIETALLRSIWYPSSVATKSFFAKRAIYAALKQTSDDPDGQIPFKLHDFGARGVSSSESAGLGGAAHLLNFKGTDTLEAILAVQRYYQPESMPGFSIPASEHSTMTSWGQLQEQDAYQNMIDRFGAGLVSIVADSYDLFYAVEKIFGEHLHDKIVKMPGKLIVRPDSGDPVETPVTVLEMLWARFGGTVNSKGYRVLHPKIGVIQGDGMNMDSIQRLLFRMVKWGYSVDNIAFGMGGGLLQDHLRDDHRFAMKANAVSFGDGWVDVRKKPATDPSKASKAGRLAVYRDERGLRTCRVDSADYSAETNLLRSVYSHGRRINFESWEAITARAHTELVEFDTVSSSAESNQQHSARASAIL